MGSKPATRVDEELTATFNTNAGIPGDAPSYMLFNLVLEETIQKLDKTEYRS